jgi:hypothetical protein
MLSGHVFWQQMWAPAIGVIGGGLLPTPMSGEKRAATSGGKDPGLNGGSRARQMLADAGFPRCAGAPAIKEIGGGLLRTPTVGMVNQDRSQDPQYMSKLLAKGQTVTLAAQMKSKEMALLPTPTTCDWKDGSQQACCNTPPNGMLGREIHHAQDSPLNGPPMYLNPSFVEEMMGFPVGWTV